MSPPTNPLVFALALLMAPFGKTASAQYVQLSTNALGLANRSPNIEVELPLAGSVALETSLTYAPLATRVGLAEERYRGMRAGLALKRYFPSSPGLYEGFYLGAYVRHSRLEFEERDGHLFSLYSTYDAHRIAKTAIGLVTGFTLTLERGFYISQAVGVGYNVRRDYECPNSEPGRDGPCRINGLLLRDQPVHFLATVSVGWRFRTPVHQQLKSAATRLSAERAAARAAEARLRREERWRYRDLPAPKPAPER